MADIQGAAASRAKVLYLLLVAACLLVSLPAVAQGPLACRECAFTVTEEAWNGTGAPGGRLGGTFRIDNTGEGRDAYAIRIETGNTDWLHDVEPDQTDDVPPGSGLFAAEGNHTRFNVTVVVPPEARAGARAAFVVVVTSQNMPDDRDGREQSVRLDARALQVHAWRLDCTDTAQVQKSDDVTLGVTARNTGNGADSAFLRVEADPRFSYSDLPRFDLAADAMANETIVLGASLRLEDDDHPIVWSLVRDDGQVAATCTTMLTVTGGTAQDPAGGDGDSGESPGDMVVLGLVIGLLLIGGLRGRPERRPSGRRRAR